MNVNLIATSDALKLVSCEKWHQDFYPNRHSIWGMWAQFWQAGIYHMISIHNCSTALHPRQVAALIEGIESIDEARWGAYGNSNGVPGFYASARSSLSLEGSTNHWYMISRSPERNFRRMLRMKRNLKEEEADLVSYLDLASEDPRLCA
jgi:hypothetical protein